MLRWATSPFEPLNCKLVTINGHNISTDHFSLTTLQVCILIRWTQTWHPYIHHHLSQKATHDTTQKVKPPVHRIHVMPRSRPTTMAQQKENEIKYQLMVKTLENAIWYVTLTILTRGIWGGIHKNNITNLFKQCYIPQMAIHACMQNIHTIVIKYLTLLMLNKCKLDNHQEPILPLEQTPKPHTPSKTSRLTLTTRCRNPIN